MATPNLIKRKQLIKLKLRAMKQNPEILSSKEQSALPKLLDLYKNIHSVAKEDTLAEKIPIIEKAIAKLEKKKASSSQKEKKLSEEKMAEPTKKREKK